MVKEQYMPKTEKLVVLMNPPYQMQSEAQKNREEFGSMQAKPIYHKFVETVIDCLNPIYLSAIVPSRWMVGGMGLSSFRERMMNDKRIKQINHFPGENEIFPTVRIKGGVNYFLWDRGYKGTCEFNVGGTSISRNLNEYNIIVQDNNAISILEKVKKVSQLWISSKCLSSKPFGLPTNYSNWVESGVPCYTRGKIVKYVCPDSYTDKNNIINRWKVATSAGINPNSSGDFEVYNTLFIAEPGYICTETYIVVNAFDTQEEAENFATYMKTRFFRFMLGIRCRTQHINTEKFAFVPDIGPYHLPITDEKLYTMFNLTRQQQTYIESKIKELK